MVIHLGDCRDVMPTLEAGSADAIVTDPPYELGFMGKKWDSSGVAFDVRTWTEALRVAKPGAFLVAFGGTRTFHRLVCAIEDAGWELRDSILRMHDGQHVAVPVEECPWLLAWTFGSGFPKSHNGPWGGTALKPAFEPIVLARKPLAGTVEANWREHGTGALNIDGCRIDGGEREWREARRNEESDEARKAYGKGLAGSMAVENTTLGRWPANLIHDSSDEVLACFPEAPGQQRDTGPEFARTRGACYGDYGEVPEHRTRGDSCSAARFFYGGKATRADRNDGCDGLPLRQSGMVSNTSGQHMTRRDGGAPKPAGNNHPTVKPTELMRWLVRLVTPRGGVVLDPFMGSGSTGRAAAMEGCQFVGIELDPHNIAIAEARIRAVQPGLALGSAA